MCYSNLAKLKVNWGPRKWCSYKETLGTERLNVQDEGMGGGSASMLEGLEAYQGVCKEGCGPVVAKADF